MNRTQKEICVGVVGANKNAGWAKMSHVPAIKSLPGLKLAALATRNEQSAREAERPKRSVRIAGLTIPSP